MGQTLGCIQVDQSTVAVKEQFYKFDQVLQPGCHCLPWCFGYQVAGSLSLRVQQLDVRCETKTKLQESVLLRMRRLKQRKYCRSRKLKEKLNPSTCQGLALLDSVKPLWMVFETVCLLSQKMYLEHQQEI
ncbi:uncharacterized protein [Solanum lycopersicum]|uniref:uncharacterized protein isoform X2 n=1 Tax=Solanum lycopersicum TaxID=4081 RepID=UPI0008FEC5BB|nr:uncharacterized protein LOC101254574 isoform X3 [Solanum lycopersicum]XP_025885639.1 uncharacterized protein LOC101254574 isoform X3 [Solanum lycopersicum]